VVSARGVFHFAQAHLFADELREFFRADFAQAFEPRDLWFAAEFLRRVVAFGFAASLTYHPGARQSVGQSAIGIHNGMDRCADP